MQRKKKNSSSNIQWWQWSMTSHHNRFLPNYARGYMMYSYTLLVPTNQRVFSKPSKEHIIGGPELSAIRRVLKSNGSKMTIIYAWNHEKKKCNGTSCTQVHELTQNYCRDNEECTLFSWLHVYIMTTFHLRDLSTPYVVVHL